MDMRDTKITLDELKTQKEVVWAEEAQLGAALSRLHKRYEEDTAPIRARLVSLERYRAQLTREIEEAKIPVDPLLNLARWCAEDQAQRERDENEAERAYQESLRNEGVGP